MVKLNIKQRENRKSRLVKLIEKKMPVLLDKYYGEKCASQILIRTRKTFADLQTEIPYVGGKKNGLSDVLYFTGWCLALYRAMQSEKKSVNETGRLIYEAAESTFDQYPNVMLKVAGKLKFAKLSLSKKRKALFVTQEKKYSEDWVGTFIEGEDESFDYGIDYTECGVCKYLEAQNAQELTKYICILDFVESKALGLGLVRSKTIARGDDVCNFRFKHGRVTSQGWETES